jgi:hypothetical protein
MSLTWLSIAFVTGAGEDGQPGILLETLVRQSQLTEKEYRSAIRFDAPGVNAVLTESG